MKGFLMLYKTQYKLSESEHLGNKLKDSDDLHSEEFMQVKTNYFDDF